jgi:hypothetical protein
MIITANGRVGIGTSNPGYTLHVAGAIHADGGYSAPVETPPDYVFEPSYKLMPLRDLESFVTKEKHLPSVPNAAEIKKEGLNIGEFQMKLLEKIEELTLYTLQQAKTIREQQTTIQDHKTALERKDGENASLNARLSALEQMMERLVRQENREQK